MTESERFTIGSEVRCADGVCGELRRVVIDPVARALTHLVVEPKHREHGGRLVPIDLVDAAAQDIRLRCSISEFEALEAAEEQHYLPEADRYSRYGYGPDQMFLLPFFGRAAGALDLSAASPAGETVTYDRVPVGEVDVRRGDRVHATDGEIGRVQGLVIDPSDHHVTHVLLDEGRLWGKKRVAIPISAVEDVSDGVRVSLTTDEVRDLPPVELDPHE